MMTMMQEIELAKVSRIGRYSVKKIIVMLMVKKFSFSRSLSPMGRGSVKITLKDP